MFFYFLIWSNTGNNKKIEDICANMERNMRSLIFNRIKGDWECLECLSGKNAMRRKDITARADVTAKYSCERPIGESSIFTLLIWSTPMGRSWRISHSSTGIKMMRTSSLDRILSVSDSSRDRERYKDIGWCRETARDLVRCSKTERRVDSANLIFERIRSFSYHHQWQKRHQVL